jgi:threonine/homoserine/homoserine lactone efflux protein
MAVELWLAFVAASTVMRLIPGPTILTVVAYASSYGKKATLPLVAAVSLGDITVITLVCLAAINTLGYALLESKASQLFNSNTAKRRFNICGVTAMSAAGVWALSGQQAS